MKRRSLPLAFVVVAVAALLASAVGATPRSPAGTEPAQPVERTAALHTIYLPLVRSAGQSTLPPPPPATATDQELIAAALAAGAIDYGTSLLYRAYALFADPRLPKAYQGAGSEGEDHSLFEAMADPTLPPAVRAALRPFLVRPAHPDSVHSRPRPASTATAPAATPASDIWCVENGWASLRSANPEIAVTVHAPCGLPGAEADMRKTLALLEGLWGPMTELMRQPIGDVGGQPGSPDDSIDFFLVEPLDKVWRDGGRAGISSGALHTTVTAPPAIANRSSAFVILARADVARPTFKSGLAHEFFHVLQSAHNDAITSQGGKTWWFAEASAVWAESHFVRETSRQAVHGYFPAKFLPSRQPLHQSFGRGPGEDRLLMYASYVWPFFMEQELGAEAVGQAWARIAEAGTDWEAGLRAIEADLPFKEHFYRFALRNLNSAFFPDNPLGTRYADLDPGFLDEQMPKPEAREQLEGRASSEPSLAFPVELPALKAHYYHFSMADSVKQVRFDFGLIAPGAERRVSALVKLEGRPWEVRELLPDSVTFCDGQEPLEEIWIVVSNHSTAIGPTVSGPLFARPLKEPCGCSAETQRQLRAVEQWNGTVSFSYTIAGSDETWDIHQHRTATVQATLNLRTPDGSAFLGNPTGHGAINDTTFIKTPQGPKLVSAFKGAGVPVPYDAATNTSSRVGLALRTDECTYNWTASVYIDATFSDGDMTTPVQVDIGSLGSGWMPAPGLVLAGGGSFPAHSPGFILTHEGPFFDQPDAILAGILGEDRLGVANVTWRFEPASAPRP